MFDSSLVLSDAAAQGAGVALLPIALFGRDLQSGRLVRLFEVEVDVGGYWLTRLKTRRKSTAMKAFQEWIGQHLPEPAGTPG
ncbi:HTH-type transcriptional activator AmpR [compost metagenome]